MVIFYYQVTRVELRMVYLNWNIYDRSPEKENGFFMI